jgi:2-polyprenyl-6-methoxyphenol hydroxylase-like FAD-dependent oxidoreductase
LLAEQGHQVTVFEQAQECQPVGAGIMIQTNGQQVLQRLGLLEALLPLSARLDGMTAELTNGRTLVRLDFNRLDSDMCALGVHRGTLFQLLLDRCRSAGVELHTGFRAVRFAEDRGKLVSAEGESVGGFDGLIVADGARSALRHSLGLKTRVIEYSHGALWATGPCDYQPGRLHQIVDGTQRLVGLLPIGRGQSSYFWGLPVRSWPTLARSNFDQWRDDAIAICPHSESILSKFGRFGDLTFGTYRSVEMKVNHTDKVILLGDSAHATSPHLGQGANLALEDAECFAQCLSRNQDLLMAFQEFQRIRYRKTRFYRQLTAILSPFFQSDCQWRGHLRNLALPWMPHIPLIGSQMLRTLSGMKRGWLD